MNRRILYSVTVLLLLAAVFPARGQRFEWATGYSGWDGCEVRGAVTDSRGNMYMIGQFTFGASWVGGEDLWPEGMYRTSDGYYTVIAKVSPEGDLVWKRIIATSDGADEPFGIKMLGDSSVMCLVRMEFPGYLHQQLYYLDTIVEITDMYDSNIDYPVSPNYEGFGSGRTMGFITLDLEGNLKEHHFIDQTYFDAEGNDYWRYNFRAGSGSAMDFMSFDVDHSGNVYLCQRSCDVCQVGDGYGMTMDASNGDIKGIRYWHNRERPIGENWIKTPTQNWFGRIVKFSPHFDTVLAVKYVFEATDNPNFTSSAKNIKTDRDNNVYIINTLRNNSRLTEEPADAVISIDTALGMELEVKVHEFYKGYLIKYDSNLVPQYCITLQDSIIVPNTTYGTALTFHDIAFDYDSNYMFLETSLSTIGYVGSNTHYFNISCQDVTLDNIGCDQTLLVFSNEATPPTFLNHGMVPSINYSEIVSGTIPPGNDIIACSNNRVVFQYRAAGGLRLTGGQAPFSDIHRYTLGHIMFDYQGNFIDEECYYTSSHDDAPGPVLMHDSSIYFISTLHSNATYGDIAYPYYPGVAIAKYVDTALLHPYETPRVGIPPMVGDTIMRVWPNPTTGPVNISVSRERIVEAWLTDASGRREAVELKVKHQRQPVVRVAHGAGVQADRLFEGDYMLDLSGHRDGLYILTFVTDNGNRHSAKILKHSRTQP